MNIEIIHHYPPEILNLLVDTIPLVVPQQERRARVLQGCGSAGGDYVGFQTEARELIGAA